MILWNTKELSNQLRSGAVTEKEKMKYFLITTLMTTFVVAGMTKEPDLLLPLHYGFMGLNLLITATGVWWAFHVNSMGDGKHFLDRIVCISLPIVLRVIALSLAVTIPCAILLDGNGKLKEQLFWHLVESVSTLAFYWRLAVWMKRTASPAALA